MNINAKDNLGARLKLARKKVKLSQIEMAEKVGITQHTFSNYENSKRFPDSRFLHNLRASYNVNLNWLISGDGPIFVNYDKEKSEQIAELSAKLEVLLRDMTY